MPPDIKAELRYARRNSVLISWIILCMGGIIGLALVALGGFYYMSRVENGTKSEKTSLEQQIASEKYEESTKKYETFVGDVKTVSSLLQKQVLFSGLVVRLAAVLPDGVVIKQMNLSEKDNALTLDFTLPNRSSGTVLQANLQDPSNKLFSSADLLSTSCTVTEGGAESCNAQIRVLFDPTSRLILYQPVTDKKTTGGTKP